jgi:mRNA deadenylase 3'-5' endonuclease subunit Ccr4
MVTLCDRSLHAHHRQHWGVHHVPHGTLRFNGLIAESTLSDSAYPYWQKKDRKPKRWQQQLLLELRTLAASVLCLQNVDSDLFQVHGAQLSKLGYISCTQSAQHSRFFCSKWLHHQCTFAEFAEA